MDLFTIKSYVLEYPADSDAEGNGSSNGLSAADVHAGLAYYCMLGLGPFERRIRVKWPY